MGYMIINELINFNIFIKMKKYFYLILSSVLSFGLFSCSQMDEMTNGDQVNFPIFSLDGVETEVILSKIDSLTSLYHRDVIVYGIPELSSIEMIVQAEKAMQQISEADSWDTYVLISCDGIEKHSINERSSILPQNDEGVKAGSFTFNTNRWPILPCGITISWAGYGASVSVSDNNYIIGRSNLLLIVESANNARISGDFSLLYNGVYHTAYSYGGNTSDSNSFSIYYYAGQYPIER